MATAQENKLNLELPRNQEGKVDWDTLGKLVTANILGEVLHASYVDKKHNHLLQEKERKQIATEWEYSHEKNGISVLRRRSQDANTYFMGRGVIDEPLEVVAALYKDVESTFIWDNLLAEAHYLKILSDSATHTDYIGYQRFETSQYCGFVKLKRDMLYYAHCAFTEDGKYVQAGVSVEDPDYPPMTDVPRMEMKFGTGFVLEPFFGNSSKTLVSYLANLDLKHIPSVIMTQVLKRHPLSICKVRDYLKTPVTQRRESSKSLLNHSIASYASYAPSVSMSARHYEDPLAIHHFVKYSPRLDRKRTATGSST